MHDARHTKLSFFHSLLHNSRAIHFAILLGVFAIIFFVNFPFASWYTGWDNLHPEFNFWLNVKRALSAVWQENQGLGTYGGHGYAATLPHTLFLWILSLVIPDQYLRSTFTFLMLLAGSAGMFFLVRHILHNWHERARNAGALLAGLFYILNFGTVQNFHIQLEAFIVHYAALPWLFLLVTNFIEHRSKKNLFIFLLVSLVTTTQGFIPPLFFVYLMLLLTYLGIHVAINRTKKDFFAAVIIFVATLIVNAYWFLPVINYTLTRSHNYLNSYNNLSSTEDFILRNQKYGNLANVSILKGFIVEAIDASDDGTIFPIFKSWQAHLDNKFVLVVGYSLFAICLLGIFALVRRERKNYLAIFTLAGLLLTFGLLATDFFPFSLVSKLTQLIPAFKQAFRVAFTKFSISLAFFYAIVFGAGVAYLTDRCSVRAAVPFICTVALIFFSWPTFAGNLLYKRTKLQIPAAYFELFDYFRSQDPKTRIANIPVGWNWGWSVYQWGYSGSGFLWYGIEQPIMDRAFDVWGKENENYFWEYSYALYSENFPLSDGVLDKYQINWIVLDKNVVPYPNVKGFLYSDKHEQYLDSSPKYKLVKVIPKTDKAKEIKIYRVNLARPAVNFQDKFTLDEIKNVGPQYKYINYDQAFEEDGIYYVDTKTTPDAYYPFRTLLTNRKTNEVPVTIKITPELLTAQTILPHDVLGFQIHTTLIENKYNELKVDGNITDNLLTINIATPSASFRYDSRDDKHFLTHDPKNCNPTDASARLVQTPIDGSALRFLSVNAENCYSISLDQFPHRLGYVVETEARNITGKKMQVSVINTDSRKADIDLSLGNNTNYVKEYLILPPMKFYGLGYNLRFNNVSIGSKETINDIKHIAVRPIPFEFLTHIKLTNPHPTSKIEDRTLYVLYQSADPGWKAYALSPSHSPLKRFIDLNFPFVFGTEIKNKVLVNNWANGWILDPQTTSFVIIFTPQYLEYAGFFLLFFLFIVTVFYSKKRV